MNIEVLFWLKLQTNYLKCESMIFINFLKIFEYYQIYKLSKVFSTANFSFFSS